MKPCCVQLFNAGSLDDVLLIWKAKSASMDADGSIDIQLLYVEDFSVEGHSAQYAAYYTE
ncbi:hypothetical protein ACIQVC_36210 [Streptomyces sp. NPDC101112]|uniref:hypothetical protein n=1 Tax=Streptomyces sp. NPDC101112 TaxID=3366105 RepID=UPI0037F19196